MSSSNESSSPIDIDFLLGQREREWVEWKCNHADPERIGLYISALSNAAAIDGVPFGFMLWGINDEGIIVGTQFQPEKAKKGNENLKLYLANNLDPKLEFQFFEERRDRLRVVALRVPAACVKPTAFKNDEKIRVHDALQDLRRHPEKARRLWAALSRTSFEEDIALDGLSVDRVLDLLAVDRLFALLKTQAPADPVHVMGKLIDERPGGESRPALLHHQHGGCSLRQRSEQPQESHAKVGPADSIFG